MILSFAQAQKSDLIVMGTHGLRGFDRTAITGQGDRRITRSVADPSIRRGSAHDSIAADQERHHLHHLGRILACTDLSEDSDLALNHAISAAAEYDAELTLLHVLEEVPRPSEMEEAIAVATEQLENLIPPQRRKTLKIKTAVRTGKPYREIIQIAQEAQTDPVSMGVRSRGALDLAVFGSTTYRVMQLGPCPVLTAHVCVGEHPDCWLEDECGWALSAFGSGLLILENVETNEGPWHMRGVSREKVLELWGLLKAVKLAEIREHAWLPGYDSQSKRER
jgi:nucleotide-binding universal stress UspA family protein